MRRLKRLSAFLVVSSLALGVQAKGTYVLQGFMGVQGGESFTYRLELTDSVGNYLSGYSYLYKSVEYQVKTAVVVERNRAAKTLHLQETEIISNNNFKSKAVICLVESDLSFDEKEQVLKGSLITQTIGNGGLCSRGTIVFHDVGEIERLFAEKVPEPKVSAPSAADSVYQRPKVDPARKLDRLMAENRRRDAAAGIASPPGGGRSVVPKPAEITEGKSVIYEWTSERVVLEVWDGGQEDDDRVTILFNGQPVLSNHTLKNQAKVLELVLGPQEINVIVIEAMNEGIQPPNTANIRIRDGERSYEIVANNTIGKRAIIRIKRK